jgi:hypothetical protein
MNEVSTKGVMQAPSVAQLERSPLFSEELGITLADGHEDSCFRWFLASILFGARISTTIARHTYEAFIRHGLTTPGGILAAGWDFLVFPIMREGGYVRYDERKSEQVLKDCRMLMENYDGSLRTLHDGAANSAELERRLLAFPGVGPVTANIFLRELRPWWAKADPDPLPAIRQAADAAGLDLSCYPRKSLTFSRVEAGLLRLSRQMRRARPAAVATVAVSR